MQNENVQNEKTISITLHPKLLLKAEEMARREDRTISELFKEALLNYIVADACRDDLSARTRFKAKP